MARRQRIAHEGVVYHVTARDNERRAMPQGDARVVCEKSREVLKQKEIVSVSRFIVTV